VNYRIGRAAFVPGVDEQGLTCPGCGLAQSAELIDIFDRYDPAMHSVSFAS